MTAIGELEPDRTVEGTYAVARKQRRTTKTGKPYLALELVDPSGRIEARVWSDVELLDGRFAEGDAVRLLGRVERFGGRLQVQVRTLERSDADPTELTPTTRRDRDELEGFLEFLAAEIAHPGLAATVGRGARRSGRRRRSPRPPRGRRGRAPRLRGRAAGAHGRRRVALPRDLPAPPATARRTSCSPPRCSTTSAGCASSVPGRGSCQTDEGRLLGHVHLGLRLVEDRAEGLEPDVLAELLHAIAVHHDRPAARTAEAGVLYHANQLDAQAATRSVGAG